MEVTLLDQFRLTCLQVEALTASLSTIGATAAVYDCQLDRVDIEVQRASDIDLLRAIEPTLLEQAKLKVGVERVALWFAGEEVCQLPTSNRR